MFIRAAWALVRSVAERESMFCPSGMVMVGSLMNWARVTVSPDSAALGSMAALVSGSETSHSVFARLKVRRAAGSSSELSTLLGSMVLYAPSQWGL